MKEKIFNIIYSLIICISIIFIFKNNHEVASIIIDAVNLFLEKVFVSLFPMFIINDILISLNFPYYFYLIFNNIFKKVFKTSGVCSYVFIMCLISGSPSNAYIIKNLVESKIINIKEANHYLYFTYFSNPLFLTLMLLTIFDYTTAIKIIAIHYISNFMIAFIKRNKAPKISINNFKVINTFNSNVIIKSINKSISTLLMILGAIVFYIIVTYIVTSFISYDIFNTIIAGFLEITNGLNFLKKVDGYIKIKEILAIAIISFGGLSIHTQVKGILEDTKINYMCFFKGRIMQVIISILLLLIF